MAAHIVKPKAYIAIFFALMALTALTVYVAYIDLGRFNLLVALLIASVKATLVVLIFMHVKYSDRLTWIFALAGLYWFVFIMLVLLFADYLTRGWLPFPLTGY